MGPTKSWAQVQPLNPNRQVQIKAQALMNCSEWLNTRSNKSIYANEYPISTNIPTEMNESVKLNKLSTKNEWEKDTKTKDKIWKRVPKIQSNYYVTIPWDSIHLPYNWREFWPKWNEMIRRLCHFMEMGEILFYAHAPSLPFPSREKQFKQIRKTIN